MNNSLFGRALLAAVLALSLTSAPFISAQTIVRVNEATDGNGRYAMQMVNLAFSKIDTKYKFELDNSEVSQARNIEDVANGKSDLLWAATNQDMENKLLPVRIPLYKGMLGHRIFIINPASQAKFDRVKTFEDLKQFTFGQGTTWADSDILASNGLKVIRTNKYQNLFYMVEGGRFDAFPRGVQEPWQELINNASLPLTVEKHIMLVYRMPMYLFTNKKNTKLAADLELGLNRAIADGSFDRVFLNDPMVKDVLAKANLSQRLEFHLDNPTLPKETPLDRPELWLDIKTLGKTAPVAEVARVAPDEPAANE
ncbi:transporter substrate-binding domain-containing protein [Cellvibrio sp. OA-2007]|uniref:transporter substrate-binding domain-containing protein n=1 Tax=Cellvibrio sp. OA-2007 TaxID=529823 RepID=UPI000781A1E4|nr:transporter substrate-binding domain-containing protein [Cellvibrio sp. OA-2007]